MNLKSFFDCRLRWTRSQLGSKNQKGVALMMAIFSLMLIVYLVMETVYEANVEYVVNANSVSRVKAYYAAKSGLDLSLLRIKLYTKLKTQFGAQIPPEKLQVLDLIWSFPFTWPPMIPEEASGVDQEMVKDTVKESKMDAVYATTIVDEGSKIDINDLGSPSKGLRDLTKKLLLQIFENQLQNDDEWARQNSDLKYEEVINNIADWVDKDTNSQNRGDEKAFYSSFGVQELPPNRGFRTVEELRLVAGMNESIFNMLKDRVTVYGMKAINPNQASGEVLKALDPSMSEKVVGAILTRRNDPKIGPFKDENEFWSFANSEGANVPADVQKAYFLVFTEVTSFRIKSVGEFAGVSREIEAIVYDFSSAADAVATQLQKEASGNTGQPGTGAKTATPANNPLPKGPPRIVYFMER